AWRGARLESRRACAGLYQLGLDADSRGDSPGGATSTFLLAGRSSLEPGACTPAPELSVRDPEVAAFAAPGAAGHRPSLGRWPLILVGRAWRGTNARGAPGNPGLPAPAPD